MQQYLRGTYGMHHQGRSDDEGRKLFFYQITRLHAPTKAEIFIASVVISSNPLFLVVIILFR